jgi:23S rRNA pseudouridine1911/1915/1917 synthase
VTGLRFELDASVEPERVDRVLVRLCPGTSRATLQRWIEEGRVTIDGSACRARDRVGPGKTIEVVPGPEPATRAEADPSVPFAVVYEDEHLLVVDKPAGVVVHPARGNATGTLVNGLLSRGSFVRPEADPLDAAGALRPGIVHRIDKNTSGLLVVAKNTVARESLKQQLQAHSVERRYRALTIGVPRAGVIRSLYGRDPRSRLRYTTRLREGKSAITELSVLESLAGGRAAYVECRLRTGRTHQIRVHLLECAKTPLLAEPLYRGPAPLPEELAPSAARIGRQALHALTLGFEHPVSGEQLQFESPLPDDFAGALSLLRAVR